MFHPEHPRHSDFIVVFNDGVADLVVAQQFAQRMKMDMP
jgi:hypothetical protein